MKRDKNNKIISCSQDSEYIEKKYFDFLKDKRIVIVGPAPHISSSLQGNIIDSYDLVVRINHGYNIPENLKKHIGRRTDIIYDTMLPQKGSGIDMPIEELKDKVKWICASYPAEKHFQDILNFKNKVKNKILFHIVDRKFWEKMVKNMKIPHSGTVSILDILEHDVSELFVTGITFYKESHSNIHYYDGYHKESKRLKKRQHGKTSKHDPSKQLNYIKEIYKKDDRFSCDNVLKKIFEKQNGL